MVVKVKIDSWTSQLEEAMRQKLLEDIESGKLIFLPQLKFALSDKEKKFLTESCADPKSKNISFDPQTKLLRGSLCTGSELTQLQSMITRFACQALSLIDSFFPHYQKTLQWGRTSFRPVSVEGRKVASFRKDDTRLHVDSFTSRPVQGLRLLRVFSNINPSAPRIWKLGEPFEAVAQRFLPNLQSKQWISPKLLQKVGVTKGIRSPYDHLMLQIHDAMKGNMSYQKTVPQREISFPSGSTWIVMTDKVSHAVLSGQFLLEQTFYLPVESMQRPEQSPLRILEQMVGKRLVA